VHFNQAVDHLSLVVAHADHVDPPVIFGDAELFASGEVRGDLGAMDYVLARKTSDVRAGTSDVLSFYHDGSLSFLGLGPGNVFAGFAAAEHNEIVFFDWHRGLPVSPVSSNSKVISNQ
jgi:hypothetical protein